MSIHVCTNADIIWLYLLGASLVSIQDPQEGRFIQQNLELLQDGAKTFWIGLYKTHEGEHTEVKYSVKAVSGKILVDEALRIKITLIEGGQVIDRVQESLVRLHPVYILYNSLFQHKKKLNIVS